MRTQTTRIILGIMMATTGVLVTQRALQAAPAAQDKSGAVPKAVLVELFTSEGCSSCPPADAILRELNGTQAEGQMVVGISEHVTYWNNLGWKDPFSSQTYTDRQNAYGDRFRLDSVYTPQVVVNGAEQLVGSDRGGLLRAIRSQRSVPSTVDVNILTAAIAGDQITVGFSAASGTVKAADIFAVIADDVDQSSVQRGENSGRTLSHVAVARSIVKVATLKSGPEQMVKFALPESFRGKSGHHLILFAQTPGSGRVLGVDTRAI